MDNRLNKLNYGGQERERFSNFVVDLRKTVRPAEKKSASSVKADSRGGSRSIDQIGSRIRAKISSWVGFKKKFKFNLLGASGSRMTLAGFRFTRFKLGSLNWRKLDRLKERPGLGNLKLVDLKLVNLKSIFQRRFWTRFQPRTARPNRWLNAVRRQERNFAFWSRLDWPRLRRSCRADSRPADLIDRKNAAEPEERLDRKAVWRSLLSFVTILLLLIIPIKLLSYFDFLNFNDLAMKIENRSRSAVSNLMAAVDSVSRLDWTAADSNFQAAGVNFLAAQEELGKINDAILSLAALSNNPDIKMAAESKKFLAAGALASSLGRNLVLATDSLFGASTSGEKFSVVLDDFLAYGHLAVTDARALEKTIDKIEAGNLPAAYRDKFEFLKKETGRLADNLANFIDAGGRMKEVLGLSRDKRYLVVFQNNAELRASGGFIGSYALVDLRDGKIRNLEVPGGGSYDMEAGMKNIRVIAPEPLWLVNPLWHFWDANWWPDWPTTAKNLMWFYEKSDGPSVDGVIGLTPTVVESLLEITGPIDLTAEYGVVIDTDNFWATVQIVTERENLETSHPEAVTNLLATSSIIVSTGDSSIATSSLAMSTAAPTTLTTTSSLPLKQGLETNVANKPKKIIGDLLAKILEVLPQKLTKDNLLKIISLFEEDLAAKQILFYFSDPILQNEVASRNWSGEIKETDKDYLLVVNSNIAGQKTDRVIAEKIDLRSEVAADGAIINTLTITRTHQGIKNAPLTGVRNVNWLRVYVPPDSELLSATGWRSPDPEYLQDRPEDGWQTSPSLAAENAAIINQDSGTRIYQENGKTVFANWSMVDPGESAVITLQYRLPFNFFADNKESDDWLKRLNVWLNSEAAALTPYSLLAQKQPGAAASEFTSRLSLPSGQEIFWRHPENLGGGNGWEISAALDNDQYWSILTKTK